MDDFDADFTHLPVLTLRCCRQVAVPGQRNFRPGGSGDWLLLYTHDGAGCIGTPAGELRVEPGDVLLYAPRDHQDYQPAAGVAAWVHSWAHFVPRPQWAPYLQWPTDNRGLRVLSSPGGGPWPELEQAFGRLSRSWWSHPAPGWKELSFNALEEILLQLWARRSAGAGGLRDPRISQAVDWIVTHLTEPFQLEALARAVNLSVSALSHRFRQETGESPRCYHERCRLELARDLLLHSQDTVTGIASQTGFSSPFYFTRRFKARYGQNPSQLREELATTTRTGV